jgi:twitching motility protein PilT
MPDAYDLTKILEEIIEDEKVTSSKKKKISQADIKKMLQERQKTPARARDTEAIRIGDLLVMNGLITVEQLRDALRMQSQKGGKLGSILVELGHISAKSLLEFLGKQHHVPGADLFQTTACKDYTSIVPTRIITKYRVLPLNVEGRTIQLAMESPNELAAIHEVEFLTGRRVQPVIVPSYQMDLALKCIEEKGGMAFSGVDMQQALQGPMTIHAMLEYLVETNGSDLFITAGIPPSVKVRTVLIRSNMPSLSPDQCVAYGKALMTEGQWEEFLKRKELDFAFELDGVGRFRINAYRQRNTISLAIRRIMYTLPSFEELGLPRWLEDFVMKPQGLILVTAPAGHGKTTSVAAMVDVINRRRQANIISLEDPIEYVHKPLKCNVNQREIGMDTDSFSEGLRRIFRQAPDVVVIGEMRDHETFESGLRAASTGHLVLSTMHAPSTTSAIDGMVNRFPSHLQGQVRQQLADALLIILSQRLIPRKDTDGMALAYESLLNSYRMKNFIRENKVHQIRSQIQTESDDYSSIDMSLIRLVKEGKISMENALVYADTRDYVLNLGRSAANSTG